MYTQTKINRDIEGRRESSNRWRAEREGVISRLREWKRERKTYQQTKREREREEEKHSQRERGGRNEGALLGRRDPQGALSKPESAGGVEVLRVWKPKHNQGEVRMQHRSKACGQVTPSLTKLQHTTTTSTYHKPSEHTSLLFDSKFHSMGRHC